MTFFQKIHGYGFNSIDCQNLALKFSQKLVPPKMGVEIFISRIGTWHAARKQCCRNVCQISKGHDHQLTSIWDIWCQFNSVSRHFMSIDVCILANFRNIAHRSLVLSSLTPLPGPIVAKRHSSIWLHQEHFILQFISQLNLYASKLANNLIEIKNSQ